MRRFASLNQALVAVLIAVSLTSCGKSSQDTIAHVGGATITRPTLDRWISALAGGHPPKDATTQHYRNLQQQALAFLISSQWLIGEATEDHLEISEREVQRRLKAKEDGSFPGGEAEFNEFLRSLGQRPSDAMFEARAEVASSKILQMLASREPEITQAQITAYYHSHQQELAVPERRRLDITNRKSRAEALTLMQELRRTKRFPATTKHFWLERPPKPASGSDADLERGVFSAKLHVLSGPIQVRHDYYVLEVRQITPGSEKPLTTVQDSIRQLLATRQRHRTLDEFIKTWRRRWIARTSCRSGFVVQKCRQYQGAITQEDPNTLN